MMGWDEQKDETRLGQEQGKTEADQGACIMLLLLIIMMTMIMS